MRAGFTAVVTALLFAAACGGGGGGGGGGESPAPNQPPVANAGPDITAAITPSGYSIDGGASSDPERGSLRYTWTIQSQPAGANGTISGGNSAVAQLSAMAPGSYVIGLRVTDPAGTSATDTVNVTLTNDAPVAMAEALPAMPAIGEEVLLDASASSDVNGQTLTYSWRVTNAPSSTNIVRTYDGAIVALDFDVEGEFTFEMTVSDGFETDVTTLGPIQVSRYTVTRLNAPFRHIAEQPGGGVVVSVHERALMVIEGGIERAVTNLPTVGTSVAVSPNGLLAAVGHSTSVSVIDLSTYEVLRTVPAGSDFRDLAIANDGFVYGTTTEVPTWRQFQSLSPQGVLTDLTMVFGGSQLRMHPSDNKMYFADSTVSPNDVHRLDVQAGALVEYRNSPYHGDYNFCGNVWLSADGLELLTACGVVLRLKDAPEADMFFKAYLHNFNPAIDPEVITQASHSRFSDRWYVIVDDLGVGASRQIRVFDAGGAVQTARLTMPVVDEASGNALFAKYVWASQTSDIVYVLAFDHPTNPQAHYLLKYKAPDAEGLNLPPDMIVQKYSAGRTGTPVRLDAGASYDPEGEPVTFAWSLVSQPAMSSLVLSGLDAPEISFTPAVPGAYVFNVTGSDGVREAAPRTVTVNVSAGGESLVYRLAGGSSDAEYSAPLNKLVYLSEDTLRLVSLSDFSEVRVGLPREGFRVAVSPDGRRAAVSHTGMVSLVNLETGALVSSLEIPSDWGDIVLDRRYAAHVLPDLGQWVDIVSANFSTGNYVAAYGARAGSQMAIHPNGDWAFSATRDTSPSSFDKWDLTAAPVSRIGQAPRDGMYDIGGNQWVSEDGDRILVVYGHVFRSTADPAADLLYVATIADSDFVGWADHSAERNEWVIVVGAAVYDPALASIAYYSDTTYERTGELRVGPVPGPSGPAEGFPKKVFFSADGARTMVLTQSVTLADDLALHVVSQ